MGRIEKTVFISYRRTNFYTALAVYQDLTQHGYDVFFDYQSIDSGDFEKVIIANIKAKAHFLVILSPSALERCKEHGDWLRREIETAMDECRNIIPLMMEGFDFGSPAVKEALSGKLETLNRYNGLRLYADYFFDAMEKLRNRYLRVEVEDARLRPLSKSVRRATEISKSSANEASPVEVAQLTAEEWFERGYVFHKDKNLDEAVRCYSEAIHLDPSLYNAYNNRGLIYVDIQNYQAALVDFNKAIELDPQDAFGYSNRGVTYARLQDHLAALADYSKAIELDPNLTKTYSNRGCTYADLQDYPAALADFNKAIELDPNYAKVYSNRGSTFNELQDYPAALEDFNKAIELNPKYGDAIYNTACCYALQGNAGLAHEWLGRAIAMDAKYLRMAREDKDFNAVRETDEFKALFEEKGE
jgi:tetratricopeptide (TPR) repeat protein